MTEHTYIKLPFMLWKEQHERFAGVLDDDSYRCEVPNSISSYPYKPHPQFTITIFGNKITVWSDINNPQSSMDEGYEAIRQAIFEECRGMPECLEKEECPYNSRDPPTECALIKILDIIGKGYYDDN